LAGPGLPESAAAPHVVYARAVDYAVPSPENDVRWSTRNKLILGISQEGLVERWEIDTDEVIARMGDEPGAPGVHAAVSELYVEGKGDWLPEEPAAGDAAPAPPPSPGPGDPELDL
jgi:hypothetical protein